MDDDNVIFIITSFSQILKQKRRNDRKQFLNTILPTYLRNIRRKNILILASSLLLRERRSYWKFEYQQFWFENIWIYRHNFTIADIFKRQFRVSVGTFELIVRNSKESNDQRKY